MPKFWRIADVRTRTVLIVSTAVGVLLTLLQSFFSTAMYRDSANVYSAMVRSLAAGDIAWAFHPEIPSLNVLIAGLFTLTGMRPEQATSLVSGLFYVATIPFIYLMMKQFLPEKLSAVGALLFACAPKIIRFSCSGLIDSAKIFFLVAALHFAGLLIRGHFRSYRHALLLGAMLGGASLARSEGVGNGLVILGCVGLFWLCEAAKERKMPPVLPCLAAMAVWALLILSRMCLMFLVFGRFIFDRRIANLFAWLCSPSAPAAASAASAGSAAASTEAVSTGYLIIQSLRGSYELYFGAAMLGLVLVLAALHGGLRRLLWPAGKNAELWRWHSFYWVLFAMIFGNMVIFRVVGVTAYRYFLINIPLLLVFVLLALQWIAVWLEKLLPEWCRHAAAWVLAFIMLGQVFNGTGKFFSSRTRREYRTGVLAGKIIREANPDARVWFREASVEWYYSGTRRAEGDASDPAVRTGFDYALAIPDEESAAALADRKDLREIPLPPGCTAKLYRKVSDHEER